MGKLKIEASLTHLAVDKHVAPSTQNQAFNALLLLYEHVLATSLQDTQIASARA